VNVTTSPLVAAYLADLDRALVGADPADRLEIVDAVREHIDVAVAELGASPTQAQIAGVLRRLGTADDVAAAWAAGEQRPTSPPEPLLRPSAHGLTPVPPDEARASRTSPWLVALVVLLAIAVVGPGLLALLGALVLLPIRASGADVSAPPGWLVLALGLLLAAAVAVCGIVWRRSTRHRRAWGIAFAVGLVLLVLSAGSLAWAVGSVDGTLTEEGVPTVVEENVPVAPTPSPPP
jgi:hypothetical protein